MNLDLLKNPNIEFWPEIRWWLAEGFHTDETLKKDIASLYDAGIGAVEFLAMVEPGIDSEVYGWGSEEWVHDTNVIAQETTKRRMGISMTGGTNWSNANLITIQPDDKAAAKELDYCLERLAAGQRREGEIPKAYIKNPNVHKLELVAVVAIRKLDDRNGCYYLDNNSAVVITDCVADGALQWQAPDDGDYLIFYFWMHGTGQIARPSVGTSYTINYLDPYGVAAFREYWSSAVLTDELRKTLLDNGRAMMYMDSLELSTFGKGGWLWGYHFVEEFIERRGYDITPFLPFIVKKTWKPGEKRTDDFVFQYQSPDPLFDEKLRNDFYQTMTDLYMDNMLRPMQQWLHSVGMELRAEISYGQPFEITQPGKYVDGIETESLEFASQIESYRALAGPAHVYNRIYSSETGATKRDYMMGIDFYNQIMYTQFAADVSKAVLHGYSSIAGSEAVTAWPGHEGMWPVYSERFGMRQPAFKHYKDWTTMLSRYQLILRQGKPRRDVAILRLDYNFSNHFHHVLDEQDYYENKGMRGGKGLYWQDMNLQHCGYTWDYLAPQILEEHFVNTNGGELLPDGPGYRAIIIYQKILPVSTARKLLELAQAGQPIVFVNGTTENVRPNVNRYHHKAACMTPYNDGADEELQHLVVQMKQLPNVRETDIQARTVDMLHSLGIRPRAELLTPNGNILTNVRQDDTHCFVYVYNMMYTQKMPCGFTLAVEAGNRYHKLNCWTGKLTEMGGCRTENGRTVVDVTLAPGEAGVLIFDRTVEPNKNAPIRATSAGKPITPEMGELICEEGVWYFKALQSGTYTVWFPDGAAREITATIPEEMPLPLWDLTVEDWNEGEKKTATEERKPGVVTTEVYYETLKTPIFVGQTELVPWKDIPQVGPEVSGIGLYRTQIELPHKWEETAGVLLCVESTNTNTAAVYVNDQKANAFDINTGIVDIGSLLRPGVNTILVEVASTLNNRLLARDYFEKGIELSMELCAAANNGFRPTRQTHCFILNPTVQNYGMTGKVSLKPYVKVRIA